MRNEEKRLTKQLNKKKGNLIELQREEKALKLEIAGLVYDLNQLKKGS
ncbi:hypothetical protein GQ568_00020 [Patescibacteria group bacterium]|nr:hypothetical protein [Patescibacteria group bacterium]